MNPAFLLGLLISLFVSLFAIIPKYASPSQEAIIQDWTGLGFNALLFEIVLYQTRLKYKNVYYAISVFTIALIVALTGVYWWIPKYISPAKQSEATKVMFNILSISVLLTNIYTKAVPITYG